MKHATGYEVYQVYLPRPDAPVHPEWVDPVAWTLQQAEANIVAEYLNRAFDGLHFFVTKVGRPRV